MPSIAPSVAPRRGVVSTPPPAAEAAVEGVSIVIPAYNESNGIVPVLEELVADLAPLRQQMPIEVIIVDDGSTDDTREKAASLSAQGVRVVRHSVNRGYGAALKTGTRHARHGWIVITDADGTYPTKRLGEMLALRTEYDMVVGERRKARIPLIRRPAKWVLRLLATYLTRFWIPDLNSGFRVIRKDAVERFERILPDGFSFTTTITLAMLSDDYAVRYLPIEYRHRVGSSKIRPISDTVSFLVLILRTILFFNPLRVFLPVSMLFFFASVAVGIGSYLWAGQLADVTTVLLFVTGVQLLALGTLADLVNRKSAL